MARQENELSNFETYELADELSDRMKLPPKDREKFIHGVMTNCGFRQVQNRESYRRADNDDDTRERSGRRHRRDNDDDDSF